LKYLVIDASVTVAWMLQESPPLALRAMQFLQSGTIGVVPDLWYYEVCNSLITAERKGRAAEQVVTSLVAGLERLAEFLEASPTTPSLLVTAARQSGLTAYDAAYWELAQRRRLPLATLDAQMRTSAQKAGIEILK
jgi:predicted nucleic acid-binding protein